MFLRRPTFSLRDALNLTVCNMGLACNRPVMKPGTGDKTWATGGDTCAACAAFLSDPRNFE